MEETLFVVPPRTVWPPASPGISARVRWKSARFVPLEVVRGMLAGRTIDEIQWSVDGPSECLRRRDVRPVPHVGALERGGGPADRRDGASFHGVHRVPRGLRAVDDGVFPGRGGSRPVAGPVKAAFRLLADSGFGGERSRGWGRSEAPEFIEGDLPDMILPAAPAQASGLMERLILDRLVAELVGSASRQTAP